MKPELLSQDGINGEYEITIWTIKNGETEICLNDLFKSQIYECEWLDKGHLFCQLNYSEWESSELIAIVNSHGQLMRDGIYSIESIIDDELLILIITGFGLGEQADYYMMNNETDRKWAVINMCGDFIIPPQNHEGIKFDYEDKIFIVGESKFTITGKEIFE